MQKNSIFRTLFLRPYGRNLLRPTASIWIFFMSLLAISLATIEGMVWGFTSSIILNEELKYVPIFIGVIVGVFIWIFDASLIQLDTSKPIFDTGKPHGKNAISRFFSAIFSSRLGWGILARLIILSISLYFTAPMLGQLFLEKEITRRMNDSNNEKVSQLIIKAEEEFNTKILALEKNKEELEVELRKEIAGNGGSGSFGFGPVAREISRQIESTTKDIEELKKNRKETLEKLTNASPEEIAKASGLSLDQDSYETRERIRKELLAETGGMAKSELLAKVFLILLFSVIIVLKMFQGKSVEVYYNDELQELYEKYLNGFFNSKLDKREWPNGEAPMAPYRFHDWIYHTFAISQQEDMQQNEALQAETLVVDTIEQFEKGEQNQLDRILDLQNQYDQLLTEKFRLSGEQKRAEFESKKLSAQLNSLSQKMEKSETEILGNIESLNEKDLKELDQLRNRMIEINQKIEKLEAIKNIDQRKLESVENRLNQINDFLKEEHEILEKMVHTRHELQMDQLRVAEQDGHHALDLLKEQQDKSAKALSLSRTKSDAPSKSENDKADGEVKNKEDKKSVKDKTKKEPTN